MREGPRNVAKQTRTIESGIAYVGSSNGGLEIAVSTNVSIAVAYSDTGSIVADTRARHVLVTGYETFGECGHVWRNQIVPWKIDATINFVLLSESVGNFAGCAIRGTRGDAGVNGGCG